ncbi:cryptochrome/photolyase family protein [Roseibium sp.]|uniref:cryptochrome/photolyase family protein n=1 Tax=Roseibium sp. TaxID=1936156 RepID=UPI003A97C5A2
MSIRNLILVLGDQLTPGLSSLRNGDPQRDCVLMVEVMEEATYVRHHPKKIAFILSAMRHFAEELRSSGWRVEYVTLDDPHNTGCFSGEVARACGQLAPERIQVTEAGEWRVRESMRTWSDACGRPLEILDDDRFMCSPKEFQDWADGRKQLRMEYFYREMRRKTGLLMDGDAPEGGRWNFDIENRKPAKADLFMPGPAKFPPDGTTQNVLALVRERFNEHFGRLDPFCLAVTRVQAEEAFRGFLHGALPMFGDYQDAMLTGEKYLYHAVISPYLNVGLLDPLDVCRQVEQSYRAGAVPLNAAEGFIRQVIGWREYVRGIYWLKMPAYADLNFLKADRDLPDVFWNGNSQMQCLRQVIGQTRDEAYAHHIQRLMVTGNFALLTGVDPRQVHEWYLSVYIDAFEWVELPNTLGMSQFADGGLLGSKPYAAGGNYINKMSDYCKSCAYSVQERTGERACPFNYLYWHFLVRNRASLGENPRLRQPYRTWERMDERRREEVMASAEQFLQDMEQVETGMA